MCHGDQLLLHVQKKFLIEKYIEQTLHSYFLKQIGEKKQDESPVAGIGECQFLATTDVFSDVGKAFTLLYSVNTTKH
ncbi:hypothetical protein Y1Q_0002318 [Alligator mississippiensis]|uniref:Uncharacterized protein n=1 Tax=Alligator mississippiensis TaxID=8496 RepID=A0A151MGN9_ALLMI|nr:hypothetical protein Y1Q_0002318 [Alligator mississippiensis]